MGKLSPYPFSGLVTRAFDEYEHNKSIFDLPARKFALRNPGLDTAVEIHGRRVSSPLGPSAGPHTQMAQNIVLCWLGGARVFELKTVQILDSLTIARPCIDARTVGLNVEWSQELKVEEALEEYVKAAMLIRMLSASGLLGGDAEWDRPIFDVSVGYDLKGIQSERMTGFMRGMLDARKTIDNLRSQIPPRWRSLRETDFDPNIATSVTLSTFHGCPVSEIERTVEYLMEIGLDCTLKLNPTLLGPRRLQEILNDRLDFADVKVPPSAFRNDPTWEQACEIIGRLQPRARDLGRRFAIKLTNTLLVENRSDFLPRSEKFAYLSGGPLHVLAMHLVRHVRRTFGAALPISFSAGIDRFNYPEAVALGLAPVTVCTDLLKQGGYGRLTTYSAELAEQMAAVGARSIPEFIRRDRPVTVNEAKVLNTEEYVGSLDRASRYRNDQIRRLPRKRGRDLGLFDCATCDLCIDVCPNNAIFPLPSFDIGPLRLQKSHQIACFADLCNDCGNCEAFCPDIGAPNRLKVRLFGTRDHWRAAAPQDGFFVARDTVLCRIDAREYSLDKKAPEDIVALMQYVQRSTLNRSRINYINSMPMEE